MINPLMRQRAMEMLQSERDADSSASLKQNAGEKQAFCFSTLQVMLGAVRDGFTRVGKERLDNAESRHPWR